MFSSLLFSSFFLLAASAPLVPPRAVPISSCDAMFAGLLTANSNSSRPQSFYFNDNNDLVYDPASKQVLDLAFQPCQPNFGKFNTTGNGPMEGHLFMPMNQTCLGVNSLDGPTFTLSPVECSFSDDSSQGFLSWVKNENGTLLFPGVTQADRSIIQGSTYPSPYDCGDSGFFGYAGSSDGTPLEGVVKLQCSTLPNTFGFFLQA